MTESALAIGASGMSALNFQLEIQANNIANIGSVAYQRRIPVFTTMMYQNYRRVGSATSGDGTVLPVGLQKGMGVKPSAVIRSLLSGPTIQTKDPYHMAIQGNGYFQVTLPSGTNAYTRAGVFTLDSDGEIVTLDGYKLSPSIKVPINALEVTIGPEGDVFAKIDGQMESENLGTITLANFNNPGGLDSIENNYFLESTASGAATIANPGSDGYGSLLQGWYEGANTDAILEVTGLISTQRNFEMNTKTVKTAESMMEQLKQLG